MSIFINKICNFSHILQVSSLPRLETEILMASILKKPREFLLTHPETKITSAACKKFRTLEKKRLKNWSIAYLIGHKEFYSLDFIVNPATLVPRPETEMMVDEIIGLVKKLGSNKKRSGKSLIIDLGTGSGAIIIAVARKLKRLFPTYYETAKFSAVDISAGALRIARQNAKIHKLIKKISFYRGSLLKPLIAKNNLVDRNLIIAANLPYLTPTQIKNSPSISHEPKLALNGGRDGLKYYRVLFRQLQGITFRSATILCEIDPGQAKKIAALADKYFPDANHQLLQDLSGQNRLFMINLSE